MGLLDELPSDWREKISERIDPKDIQKIEKNLESAGNICPARDDIFKAFHLCRFQDVKVVIVGQNPYTNGAATGLAFAVKSGHSITTSLERIFGLLMEAGKTRLATPSFNTGRGREYCFSIQSSLLNLDYTKSVDQPTGIGVGRSSRRPPLKA